MASPKRVSHNLATRLDLQRGVDCRRTQSGEWELGSLGGRLVELSGGMGGASLTVTAGLIRRAQLQSEPAAWVGVRDSVFYPPDFAASGVDLDPLPVVLLPEPRSVPLAAELLVRSGAFALVIIDLGSSTRSHSRFVSRSDVPLAELTRLAGLAKHHDTVLVFLTEKTRQSSSLGTLVSLRAEVHRRVLSDGRYACELEVIKDKRRAPGWTHTELCRGPAGLC